MSHISGVASAMPEHRYDQEIVTETLTRLWHGRLKSPRTLQRLHARTGVDTRHLAFPLERYVEFAGWGETNAAWLERAEELGASAIDQALDRAGLERRDIDALFVVSITGVASPSLDARLINRMGLRPNIKRTPIFGVGCVGGALGLTRAADYTRAYPGHCAVLLAVEICSLTFQRDDLSTANLISTGLFGDGAGALVVAGRDRAARRFGPEILATRSEFYPNSEDIMGWEISEAGFRIVLSPQLPDFIRGNLAPGVGAFLAEHGLGRTDIGRWIIHTGGPKVLQAMGDALELGEQDLARSWDCLRRVGNLSSASVLLVLEDVAANHAPPPGTLGLLLAMGPGFCAEMVLLRW